GRGSGYWQDHQSAAAPARPRGSSHALPQLVRTRRLPGFPAEEPRAMCGPPLRRSLEGETSGRNSIAAACGNPRQQGGQTGAVGTAGPPQSLVSTLEFPARGWRLVPEGRRSDRVARDIVGRRPAGGRTKVLSLVVERAAAPCRSAFLWLGRNTGGRFAPTPLQLGDPEIERAEDHQADRSEPDDFRQRIFWKLGRLVADQLRHLQ